MTLACIAWSLDADAASATDGATLWAKLKSMWFGFEGLIVGTLCAAIGVLGFFRNGLGWSCVVFGVMAVFFLIPGLVSGIQAWSQAIAG